MPTPEVSIIVAVLNGEPWLRSCLESLLAVHYPREDMEIIFVDNGSTDGSIQILREFEPRIRLLHESRRGPSATRNAGVRAAAGRFLAVTDCDCLVHPEWLAGLVQPLRNAQYAAVGGKILARPEAVSVELFGEIIHDHAMAIEYYQPPYLIGMNMAVSKEFFMRIGLFDERWIRWRMAMSPSGFSKPEAPSATVTTRLSTITTAIHCTGLLARDSCMVITNQALLRNTPHSSPRTGTHTRHLRPTAGSTWCAPRLS